MSLRTINLSWESEKSIIWAELTSHNMSLDMLHDIDMLGTTIHNLVDPDQWSVMPTFLVFRSKDPAIFNLGGDLKLFYRCLENADYDGLAHYAHACIHALYRAHMAWNLPLNTIAMVEGQCYGGGLEGTLACDFIIANNKAEFGLPEPLFNLFPGMGAYTFLSDRVGKQEAERMCTCGDKWSTEYMVDQKLVDMSANEDYTEQLVRRFIEKKQKKYVSTNAFRQIRRRITDVDPTELRYIVDLWLDGIKHMSMKDKKVMFKLIRAQEKLNATE